MKLNLIKLSLFLSLINLNILSMDNINDNLNNYNPTANKAGFEYESLPLLNSKENKQNINSKEVNIQIQNPLSPKDINKAKIIAIKIVTKALENSSGHKFDYKIKKLLYELDKDDSIKLIIANYVKLLNQDLEKDCLEYGECVNENKKKERDIKLSLFWDNIRKYLCEIAHLRYEYTTGLDTVIKSLPNLKFYQLKKLEHETTKRFLIYNQYYNRDTVVKMRNCAISISILYLSLNIFLLISLKYKLLTNTTNQDYKNIVIIFGSLYAIFIASAFGTALSTWYWGDMENLSDLKLLLKEVQEAIVNYIDTDMIADPDGKTDEPQITEIIE